MLKLYDYQADALYFTGIVSKSCFYYAKHDCVASFDIGHRAALSTGHCHSAIYAKLYGLLGPFI